MFCSTNSTHNTQSDFFCQFITYLTGVHYFQPCGSYSVPIPCFKTLHQHYHQVQIQQFTSEITALLIPLLSPCLQQEMVEGEITEKVPSHLTCFFLFSSPWHPQTNAAHVQAGFEPAGQLALFSQSKIKQTKTEEVLKNEENCPIYLHQTWSM